MKVTITLTKEIQTQLRALSAAQNRRGVSAAVEQVVDWFVAETAYPDAWMRMASALAEHARPHEPAKKSAVDLDESRAQALRALAAYRGEARLSALLQDALDWYCIENAQQDGSTQAAGHHESATVEQEPPPASVYRCYILKFDLLGDKAAIVRRIEASLTARAQEAGSPFQYVGEDDGGTYRSVIWRQPAAQHIELHLVEQGAGIYLMTAAPTVAEAERIGALMSAEIPCYTVAELAAKVRAVCERQPKWLSLLAIATNEQFDAEVLKILEEQLHSRNSECRREAVAATSHLVRWPQILALLRSARRAERDRAIIPMLDFQILLCQ